MNDKPLREFSVEELCALPEAGGVFYDEYPVVDGTVTLIDGRVMTDVYGIALRVPRMRKGYATRCHRADPVVFWGADGVVWRPVMTDTGWAKVRFV